MMMRSAALMLTKQHRDKIVGRFVSSWSNLSDKERQVLENPSKYVEGLTKEQVQNDEAIARYLIANYAQEEVDYKALRKKKKKKKFVIKSNDEIIHDVVEEEEEAEGPIRSLYCFRRFEEGSRPSRRNRLKGMIPGLVYGGDPFRGIPSNGNRILVETDWSLLQRELDLFYRLVQNRVYNLAIYDDASQVGTSNNCLIEKVIPTQVQFHPIHHKVYSVNYLRYHPLRPIDIPLVHVNQEESPDMKSGGFIASVNRYLNCLVEEGVEIPTQLEVDCTGLSVRDVVRLDRIIIPDGVKPTRRVKKNFLVGTVFGPKSGGVVKEETTTEEQSSS